MIQRTDMSTESTISDENVPDQTDRQSMIEYYVDELITRIIERPLDSIPQLFRHVTEFGPCVEPAHVLHIFGGSIIFRRTCERMNLIRDAALRDTLDAAPVDPRLWGGAERDQLSPPFHDFRPWWCPHIYDRTLFWYEGILGTHPGMYRDIVRFPVHTDTEEYFRYEEEDRYPTDTEMDEWPQTLNIMDGNWHYDNMEEDNPNEVVGNMG